jgi:predicted TIM-barrel fold metal-dependent hydrolase
MVPAMSDIAPGTQAWLDQVREEVLEPERRILDPHHHLWRRPQFGSYELDDLWRDTSSGHRVEKTVFIECRAFYRDGGPEHLRSVGESEAIAAIAKNSRNGGPGHPELAGIVAHTDLTKLDTLDEALDAHAEAGGRLFKGIRHAGARDPHPEALTIPGRGLDKQYERDDFREGVKRLGKRGLTYDTWHYHHQNQAYAALARAVPDTQLVFDHFGTPLGVGRFRDQREAIFEQWKKDIAEIARCPNVVAKLGGLAMPDNGFGFDQRSTPATSDELLAAQRRYYMHAIECFGPERCMFESNFPVDRRSIGYAVLWNAFKKLAREFSESEKHALFFGTAERIYRL